MFKPPYQADTFPHWTTLPVRYRDLDPLKHVNNAIYSTYYEEARIHFLQQVPELETALDEGFSFVLIRQEIHFIQPVTYPAEILVGTGIEELGNTSISGIQAAYGRETKELLSTSRSSGVWFNLDEQKPAMVPDLPDLETLIVNPG